MITARNRHGVVLIWVVLILLVLVTLGGLAADVAYLLLSGQKLQSAADAAALAGAGAVKVDTLNVARQRAHDTAAANVAAGSPVLLDVNAANIPDGEIVAGYFSRRTGMFTPGTVGANAMMVNARRPGILMGDIPLVFGPLMNRSSGKLARAAIAMSIGGTGAGIIALDPHAPDAFYMHGNCVLNLPNGAIQVNSDNLTPLGTSGTPTVNVPDINVVSETGSLGSNTTFGGNLNLGSPLVADPLKHLQDNPPPPGTLLSIPEGKDVTLGPGYYPGGIKLSTGSIHLLPGVYVLSGNGLEVTGGTLTGEGVMIYVTGTGKTEIKFTGNGEINLSPMTSGPYAGVTLFQDVNLHQDVTLNGTDQLHVHGTLYFPGAMAYVNGTGDGFGDQLIANTIQVGGTGVININYNGSFPSPGIVFLVK